MIRPGLYGWPFCQSAWKFPYRRRIGDRQFCGDRPLNDRKHTQIKHLSYIGDAEIGSFVNIGAGSITANYDEKRNTKLLLRKGQIAAELFLWRR